MIKTLPLKKGNNEYSIDEGDVCTYMCGSVFEEYFALENEPEGAMLTVVVSDAKPKGRQDNVYHLTSPSDDKDCYYFADDEEDAGSTPWDADFDSWLNNHFNGEDVWAWIE